MAFNSQMHDRNIYKNRPDFGEIALNYPEFRKYALVDAKGKVRVDFTDPSALRILTKILLKKDFNLTVEIPKGFLIPTVPQRLNYILWIEDLLSILATKNKILRGIDVGCGPCAIFSILGAKKNGWMFTSTEASQEALQWAVNNIKANDLCSLIKVMKVESNSALSEVLSTNEDFDFCLCNPPFFENMEDIRKKSPRVKETITTIVKQEEIFAEGGEVAFVKRIIDESLIFKNRVKLYTSMFGKKKSFVEIFKVLQSIKDISVTKSQFCQGNTIRWGVAWTFDKSVNFGIIEKPKPKKSKKAKPPLVYHIPKDIECANYSVQELSKIIWNTLKDLEILIKVIRVHEHYTESQITTDKNTWSHQRRKRREIKRNVENTSVSLNKNSECELIITNSDSKSVTTNNINTITSISMPDALSEKVSETVNVYEDSKIEACEKSVTSLNHPLKKRKLDADNSSNCKKPRINLEQSEQGKCEPISQCCKDISVDNSDSNKLDSASCHNLKEPKELEEIISVSESVKSSDINITLVSMIEASNQQIAESDSFHTPKNESLFALKENKALKLETPEACFASSNNLLKKRKVNEDNSLSCKSSADNCDSKQMNSASSHILIEPKEKMMEIVSDFESNVHNENYKESERIKNKAANLIKAEDISDLNFEPKSLLFCTLKIRRAKDLVVIEMNCPEEVNRESMYQIHQYLKNKLH